MATADTVDLELQLEEHRRGLTGYCYRMLGSSFDAEDAVQETMLRAWRSFDRFEGRSALKSWLFSIATNVCLDQLDGAKRRARPMELTEVGNPLSTLNTLPEVTWVEPIPEGRVLEDTGDPAALAQAKETLRLAFITALQHLPPKQRAVLILREVLRWKAEEVATLLDTSVASVNSALQRARASIDQLAPAETEPARPMDAEQQTLLDNYVSAFTEYDIDRLVTLLAEDATLSMPPYDLWLVGREHIHTWHLTRGIGCKGSLMIPTTANGMPAFGQYRPSGPGGAFEPWALQVMEISGGRIVGLNSFLDTARIFPMFGLPAVPDQHLL